MTSIVIALLIAQTTPTRAEAIGSMNAIYAGMVAVHGGTVTPTVNAAQTRSCVPYPNGVPAQAHTVRFGVVILSPTIQRELGLKLPPGATTWQDATDQYGAMEVQAIPDANATFNARILNQHLTVFKGEVEARASPAFATCGLAVIRVDDAAFASSVRCACRVDATCLWDPDGVGPLGSSPAPIGLTLNPGSFTGAGCRRKPCIARFDGVGVDRTWPVECPR